MVDNRGEVGGSVQAHTLQALIVGLHHAVNTAAVRVLRVTVLHTRTEDKMDFQT